jgi:hypothetical protein
LTKGLPKRFHFPKEFHVLVKAMPATHLRLEIWLDAATYLPVRIRTVVNNRLTSTETDTWLPRTSANLAKTRLVIPIGFKHPVPQRGEGFGVFTSTVSTSTRLRCHA